MLELEIDVDETREILEFEHSLVSLSKWESIHKKPYYRREHEDPMTDEEIESYFECMLLSGRDHRKLLSQLSEEQKLALTIYINMEQTASTIADRPEDKKESRRNLTSELIYYWMIAFKIPYAYETWHLSRLFMLIRICGEETRTDKKPTPQEQAATAMSMRELNERRRKELGTSG